MIRRILAQGIIAGIVILAALTAVSAIALVANDPIAVTRQQRVERELQQLQREHLALQAWVIDVLRPWVIRQAYKQSAALPSGVPTPSLAPLPPVPSPTQSPITTPPSTIPSPTSLPTPSSIPSESPTCIPVVDICVSISPQEGGE